MRRCFPWLVILGLAFVLSALTVPMSFLAAATEARAEHGSTVSAVIRFIWCWGIDLTNGMSLSEPWAELLMYSINFSVFFVVLFFAYRICLLLRKFV